MATIHFERANAYGITVEDIKKIKESTFKDLYIKAYHCVYDIVSRTMDRSNDKRSSFFYDVEENNNIVAFTGERGSGKTTAMLSFVNFLREDSKVFEEIKANMSKEDIKHITDKNCNLSDFTFVSLPVIDPSKLASGESLLGLVVARIYEDIKRMSLNSKHHDYNFEPLRRAVEKCEETYKAIRVKHQSFNESMQQNPDDLEHLSELANTSQLRKSMQELIQAYLELWIIYQNRDESYPLKGKFKNSFLLIPVDDLDTNIEKGYIIAEEIRCFFMLPNVIIPIALKIEQLSDLVEQKFMSDFGKMLDRKNVLDAQPAEMAAKYIQKLIPMQRRIMLPVFEFHSLNDVTIITNKTSRLDNEYKEEKLVDYFMKLVWKTTGILLTKNQYDSHPLIPLNLRAMHQLIDLLESMQGVTLHDLKINDMDKNAEIEVLHKNLNRLESWILDSVSSNAVHRGMANILRRFVSHPNEGLNSFLVKQLVQFGIDENIREIDKQGEIKFSGLFGHDDVALSIIQTDIRPENISIGDILYLLNKMLEVNSSEGTRHFVAAVKILYSIRISRFLFVCQKEIFKPNFESIKWVLGGLICNPALSISPTGQEWITNSDYKMAFISYDNKLINLHDFDERNMKNSEESVYNHKHITTGNAMTLSQAIWISFFIVAYGRLRKKNLHSFEDGSYPDSRVAYNPKRDDLPIYISAHWLAFVTSILTIDVTIERFFGINSTSIKKMDDYNAYKSKLDEWQRIYLSPLPINSIDIIGLLLENMHNNRYKRDYRGNISKLNDYFTVKESLIHELDETLKKTCIGNIGNNLDDLHKNRKKIIDALKECPIINADEVTGEYLEIIDAPRCFDWLIGI